MSNNSRFFIQQDTAMSIITTNTFVGFFRNENDSYSVTESFTYKRI